VKSVLSGLKYVEPKFAATEEAAEAARVAKVGDEAASAALKIADKLPSSFGYTADDLL
jgi:filamentous hemagglutinin